jgi:hypothetical protein
VSNALYPKAKAAMLSGAVDLLTSTVRIQMFGTDAVYDATDEFLSDVVGTDWGSPVTINTKDVTSGEFTGTNGAFNIPEGAEIAALIIYIDTGVASTSRLLAWIDTKSDTSAFVFTSTGQPVQPYWNDDPYFSIGG